MTRPCFSAAVAALLLVLAVPAGAPAIGTFDVKPVNVNFAPGVTSASVEFTNAGAAPQELEVAVDRWSRSDGGGEDEPTDDIVASPTIFIIAPGQTQLVRLGPVRPLTADVERTYRLVATEVPPANKQGTVQTVLRMRLPVFIAPQAVDAVPLTWHVARADATRLTVTTDNSGNVHKRIRSLRVSAAGRVVFEQVVAAYVFAHESRDWSVPLTSADGPRTVTVHAVEMDGATQDSSFSVR